jgi:DedD protein
MAASQDTEITLGTGRMIGIFFALVVLCAVVFGMGFSVGKNYVKVQTDDPATGPPVAKAGKRPSAVNQPAPPAQSPDMTFYKSVGQANANSELSSATPPATPSSKDVVPDANAAPPANEYFVQVAAVSKQDDADALVDALKKKQYNAVAAQSPTDKLFHVQVGPFAAMKDAESMRSQLLSDGYNPILKK